MDEKPPGASPENAGAAPSTERPQSDEPRFYGGQAVIEGVMMRGADKYAVAVRRADGEIVLAQKNIENFGEKHKWAKWPLVRGNVALIDSLILGFAGLQFSADVLAQEEHEKLAAEAAAKDSDGEDKPEGEAEQAEAPPGNPGEQEAARGLGPLLMGLTTLIAFALAIGLFILLPTWIVDWLLGKAAEEATYGDSVLRNLIEGGIRLLVVVLYILAISLMKYVRQVFEYHGAEHATINCLESGEEVTQANCLKHSVLHPRCGTAFLLVVIVVKIIFGCFFGWPVLWLRMLIRLALLPIVAAIAYEVIRWAGRHRDSAFSRVLAAPGMLMQVLTTRRPDESQLQVAMYSLAAIASEFDLPADWPPARRLPIPLHAKLEKDEGTAGAEAASE